MFRLQREGVAAEDEGRRAQRLVSPSPWLCVGCLPAEALGGLILRVSLETLPREALKAVPLRCPAVPSSGGEGPHFSGGCHLTSSNPGHHSCNGDYHFRYREGEHCC